MKKDISKLNFSSIVGWRGDSMVCPQAFGGDIYSGCSMNCFFCFCREMEEELFSKYYTGWSRDLVRGADPVLFRKLFDKAFGSDKEYNDWTIKCLRYGLPFNMGSKAETFGIESTQEDRVLEVLSLFREYKVPMILETKSHYVGLPQFLDILKDINVAIIVSIMGGSDTLNYKLEPLCPNPSVRWFLVNELNQKGFWCGVRWEPIMPTINSGEEIFTDYVNNAIANKAKHISIYNYRTSNVRRAQEEFEKRGFNYIRMLENNLDEKWKPIGKTFFKIAHSKGIPISSPDFVNFPFDNSKESCCGTDGLFKPYQFTFQHACKLIKDKGSVSWEDMENIPFKNPDAYDRMKQCWNGKSQYFSLKDSPEIRVLDVVKGMNVYGRRDENKKIGLLV